MLTVMEWNGGSLRHNVNKLNLLCTTESKEGLEKTVHP